MVVYSFFIFYHVLCIVYLGEAKNMAITVNANNPNLIFFIVI